ncbi:MAG: SPFH domain-containing protein [Clostridia bacterium]|nr:SPFH domain-containing protein [Clostridia bacterium]
MGKFALECPKCGSLNTASTFFLARKVIQCGTCGDEINVGQSRMISKRCSKCGKVVVCDQAKMRNKKCPSCGEAFGISNATAEYALATISCPQCSCQIEVNKKQETETCPVCDRIINVKEAIAKADLVSPDGISVIKYEGDNSTFIWKHPIEDFNMGSQLIVHESQEAIFFLNGEALDTFGPGRHTLETENLPVLKRTFKLPTGAQNPFHAEVYFINKTVQMGVKWGTDSRVRFIEPNTGIPMDIGASGEMNLQVSDGRKLLIKLVGTTNGLSRGGIGAVVGSESAGTPKNHMEAEEYNNGWTNTLNGMFRPLIRTTVKTHLATAIKAQNINILEIDEHLEALSATLREKISEGFEEYGLTVPQFYVTNVSLPEGGPLDKIRNLLAASYLGVREAEVKADITAAERKISIEKAITETELAKFEAERTRIAAQAEADKRKYEGFAEAEVMAAQGYSQKDVLQTEVQKAYAEGIGNMGGSGGGSGVATDVMGLGLGLAAAGALGGQVGDALKGFSPTANSSAPGAAPVSDGWDCSCGAKGIKGKFCSECGAPKPEVWDCPSCGAKGIKGKFCSECGTPKPEAWDCPSCGAKGNKGKFCSECGKPKDAAGKEVNEQAWDCSCGAKGITGKFCYECGAKKEDN